MPINTETLNRKLYNKLSKYSPKPLDASGKVTPVEDEADVFKFKFAMDGKDYGDVFATVDDERRLILYYGDDVGDSPDTPTQGIGYNDTWLGFIEDLKSWKTRNGFKGWQLKNQDQLAPDMARRNHMKKKDNLGEAYYPMGKKASYSDSVPTIKMVIQHTRQIEEGEQRYRNIAKIFLENQDGERFLAPTLKPGIARVYARHIAEGGKPHDERWNHIGSLCEEYQKMAGFVRATRGQQFNESAQQLVESGIEHYYTLRESLSKLTGHRGYNAYFESWTPPLMEDDSEGESINELFVQETVDPRIESVMPILSRLHKKVAETKIDRELNQLAEWAESLELIEDESLTSNNPVGIPEARSDDPDEEMDGDSCSCHAPGHPEYHGTDPHCPIHGKEADPDSWAMEENFINMAPQAVAEVLDTPEKKAAYQAKAKASVPALNQQYSDARKKAGRDWAPDGEEGLRKHGDQEQLRKADAIKNKILKRRDFQEEIDEGDYPDGSSIKTPSKQEWQQQYQQAVMAVKNAKTQQEYEAASERAGHIKDLLASKGIKVGPALEQSVAENLDPNQKRVGQLGPTEKVKNNNIGKLVGANENFINTDAQAVVTEVDTGEYDARKSSSKGETTPEQEKEFRKKVQAYSKELEQRQKEKVKEGQEDLNTIKRLLGK